MGHQGILEHQGYRLLDYMEDRLERNISQLIKYDDEKKNESSGLDKINCRQLIQLKLKVGLNKNEVPRVWSLGPVQIHKKGLKD